MANSPARSVIDVGTVIAGTYTIEALIGRGGMGAVFLASHARLPGKQVAIKVLHADLSTDDILARFRREAEIASKLGHPNIVIVHDSNTLPDGTPYLVLEYLVGENLAQRIARGPIAVADTLTIVRQIASALAAAHGEGIIHRDLKPQNVFLVPTEVGGATVEQVKVLDFGISKIRGSQTVKTQDSAMLGTPQYMSPEQATGKHDETDERTDLFALGSIVYEMLCGQPAFTGQSVPEVVYKVVYEDPVPLIERAPGIDPALAAVVHRALAKKAADRFPSASAMVEALVGRPVSLNRAPRGKSSASAPPSGIDTGGKTENSSVALANTVGSGDHGAAPSAIADTLASGDHRDSRIAPAPGATPPSLALTPPPATTIPIIDATTTPRATPPVAPARDRGRWLVLGGIAALAAGAVIVYTLTRGGGTAPARDAGSDAATVAAAAPLDAALAASVTPIFDAPAADTLASADATVTASPDASPVRDARTGSAGTGTGKKKVDAAVTPVATADTEETDRLYADGLKAHVKNPQRTQELGNRLVDRFRDPRGWVLIGAAACQENDVAFFTQAKQKLARDKELTAKLYALCQSNLPTAPP